MDDSMTGGATLSYDSMSHRLDLLLGLEEQLQLVPAMAGLILYLQPYLVLMGETLSWVCFANFVICRVVVWDTDVCDYERDQRIGHAVFKP